MILDDTCTEEWYEMEYSVKGANDWFSSSITSDSLSSIESQVRAQRIGELGQKFDYRTVRKTITRTSQVVPE